jgi:hypothetical protein
VKSSTRSTPPTAGGEGFEKYQRQPFIKRRHDKNMAKTHELGQFLLVYPAIDYYSFTRLFSQLQTELCFPAGTGAGQVQVQ